MTDSLIQIIEITGALLVLSGIFLWRHRLTESLWDAMLSLSCAISAWAATAMFPIPFLLQRVLHGGTGAMNPLAVLWMMVAFIGSSALAYAAFRHLQMAE
ncbi:hypothetical protein [Acidithiobacillus thiooxidans]|jgi:hypothetical protein|uniref:Uncharacterized protein n=1 Tax=Acidithiobacillus thiooxidans ATCC 19377 TaxID=637390 RepID=A0A543Q1Q7_ACITH|nr:hypothetical protein [Acidithiobacillus thiooxidans]MDX5935602.1 hypothetical protein [Acidithiobacillus thiooxidans]TQN50264.1 hypothetical protein DLNHIDIE_00117 [Acidithiobacillus thiooxidans ATCC 19377]